MLLTLKIPINGALTSVGTDQPKEEDVCVAQSPRPGEGQQAEAGLDRLKSPNAPHLVTIANRLWLCRSLNHRTMQENGHLKMDWINKEVYPSTLNSECLKCGHYITPVEWEVPDFD